MKRIACALLLACVLVFSMNACQPAGAVEGLSQNTTDKVSQTNFGTAATTSTSATTPSTTAQPPSTSAKTTAPEKRKVVSVLRKKWDSIDKDTKETVTKAGVTRDDLVVDKSTLTYDSEGSSKNISEAYETFKKGEKTYTFNDPAGKLTAISFAYKEETGTLKTEAEIKAIASAIADLVIDIKSYEAYSFSYDENTRMYAINFDRKIGEYKTLEGIRITINVNGYVKFLGFSKIGLFDNVKVPAIDEKSIDEACREVLSKRYPNMKDFQVRSRKLDIKDGQLLAYYQKQPDIKDGELVMICDCVISYVDQPYQYADFVLVPIQTVD